MDERTRRAIEALARKGGKSRNALINEAVREYVRSRSAREWPEDVSAWFATSSKRGATKMPPFESHRSELARQSEPDL